MRRQSGTYTPPPSRRRRASTRWLGAVLSLLAAVAGGPAAADSSLGEQLRDAAKRGDGAAVRALLEAGAEVDAATEYGVTPLFFAATRGHLDVVRLLLAAGADANVRDRFYDASPLSWSAEHTEVVVELLEHGADPEEALILGAHLGNSDLVAAALDQGPPQERILAEAVERARSREHAEVAALLEAAESRPDDPPPALTAAHRAAYAGAYEDREGGDGVTVAVDGEVLTVTRGGETRRLSGVAEDRFRAAGEPDWKVSFFGRSGIIEGIRLTVDGEQKAYFATDEEDAGGEARTGRSSERPAIGAVVPSESGRWPAFRGRNATGVASGPAPPASWNVESGENVLWVADLPGRGHASPIVWDGRIFVATAVSEGEQELRTGLSGDVGTLTDEAVNTWKLIALDAANGEVLWTRDAGSEVPEFERHWKSTQANSTPATDGRRVVAVFPGLGLYCWDLDGELLWKRDPGPLDSGWFYDSSFQWGFGSSPVLFDDRVLLQVDVQGDSYLAAWDAATGEELWRTPRPEAVPGWSTPAIVPAGDGHEIVANGRTIRAYDPETGRELWSLGPNSELPIATPVATPEAVFVSAGYPPVRPIYAVAPGGRGDISNGERVLWSHDRGGAYMPTPILHGGVFHVLHHDGRIEAYDPSTGERLYRARFSERGAFTASPVAAGEHLYFGTEEGTVYTAKAGDSWQELAVNDMGDPVMATPAIADGVLYVRTFSKLYAIGGPAGDD